MIYYKDCDLETGVIKLLQSFAEETNQDYLTIQKYQQLIVDFVNNHNGKDFETVIYDLEGDLEDKQNAIASLEANLSELSKLVSGMRKSPIKEAIEDVIARMELDIC